MRGVVTLLRGSCASLPSMRCCPHSPRCSWTRGSVPAVTSSPASPSSLYCTSIVITEFYLCHKPYNPLPACPLQRGGSGVKRSFAFSGDWDSRTIGELSSELTLSTRRYGGRRPPERC